MTSRRAELVAANAALRDVLGSGARARLRAIPGVRHVSVGLKETSGEATDTLCIRVYVRQKRADDQLAPAERIPRTIDGVPTDVVVVRDVRFTVNTERVRPLKGGSLIGNRIIVLNAAGTRTAMSVGTVGCAARRSRDGAPVLLSNWHVLTRNGADVGSPVYQPPPIPIPPVDAVDLPLYPTDNTDRVATLAHYAITTRVDAAIATLDVSSCCRCCGLDYRDEVAGLSEGGAPASDRIAGRRGAVAGATVYKVGAMTGRTVGTIVDTDFPDFGIADGGTTYTFTGQIAIANTDPTAPFSVDGDSGSVIVDEDGYVVGLLFASSNEAPPAARSIANHIADVCSEMGIQIGDDTANDTAGAVGTRFIRVSDEDVDRLAVARGRLQARPSGEWLWCLAETHRREVVELVTSCRPVTVAWHRAGGPALVAAALNTLRAGGETLPVPTDGTLEEALRKIAAALYRSGSPVLRADLDAFAAPLLAAVRESSTVSGLLESIESIMPANVAGAERQ